jgi:hypothetical protein
MTKGWGGRPSSAVGLIVVLMMGRNWIEFATAVAGAMSSSDGLLALISSIVLFKKFNLIC